MRFLAIFALAACQDGALFEPIDFPVSADASRAAYPKLLPPEQLASSNAASNLRASQPEQSDALAARSERLRNRAAGLSGPVMSNQERQRLLGALAN